MPLFIPEGYGLAAWRFSLSGDPEEMVTTCGITLEDAEGNYAEAANNCFRAWSAQFNAAQLDTDWTVHGVRLWVSDGGGTVPYDSTVAGYSGAAGGITPVQNTAILVRKATALAGRRGRGRFYWPPYGLGGWSPAGVMAGATVADYQSRFTAMYNAMDSGSGAGVTFAVPPFLFHDSEAVGPTHITAFTVQAQLATQRRRLRK